MLIIIKGLFIIIIFFNVAKSFEDQSENLTDYFSYLPFRLLMR